MPPRTPDSVLAPFMHRLGQEPDHIIAREAGVSRALIIAYRKRLGILPYEGYKFGNSGNPVSGRRSAASAASADAKGRGAGAFRGRRSQLDPFVELLGKVPDAEIAHRAGVTPENVRTYRGRRGIPAAWQSVAREDSPPRPPSEAPSARSVNPPIAGDRTAYLVNVDKAGASSGYAILASDIADAARVAVLLVGKHHPGATIKAIQRIGALLE